MSRQWFITSTISGSMSLEQATSGRLRGATQEAMADPFILGHLLVRSTETGLLMRSFRCCRERRRRWHQRITWFTTLHSTKSMITPLNLHNTRRRMHDLWVRIVSRVRSVKSSYEMQAVPYCGHLSRS